MAKQLYCTSCGLCYINPQEPLTIELDKVAITPGGPMKEIYLARGYSEKLADGETWARCSYCGIVRMKDPAMAP